MRSTFRRSLGVRLAALGLVLSALALPARAQTQTIVFHKLSDVDDSVDDFRSGIPALRQCPAPCQTLHVVIRIINCSTAASDGTCTTPNARAITGGVFNDTPPVTLPLDCSRGVTFGGTGTHDPAVCDVSTNTVSVGNISVPGGQTMTISFWCNVDCDNGAVTNTATFDYDQNPNANPINSKDPIGAFQQSLLFEVGTPTPTSPTKNAPDLPIGGNPQRRNGQWGVSTHWVIEGNNPNCGPGTFQTAWDDTNPDNCLTVDCSTLRFFINGFPQPLPAGSNCPDRTIPAPFSLGSFTLQPHDTFKIEYDALFTDDRAVGQCCNVMFFRTGTGPDATTVDPSLDTRLTPEYTCVNLALGTATVVDAIKDAEDASGRIITQVRPGDDVYWHFTLSNQGGDDVDFTLDDDFPAAAVLGPGAIVDPFPVGTCSIVGQHLSCTGVTVAAMGGTAEMRVRTSIDCSGVTGGEDICNEGTVTATGATGSQATHCSTCLASSPANRTCVTMLAPSFDFAHKTVTDASGDGLADVGEVLTYEIDTTNSGTTDATTVVVTDAVPADATYVPGSLVVDGVTLTDAADGDAGDVTGGVVTVRFPTIGVLDFSVGKITFQVTVAARNGTQICNAAAQVAWSEAAACSIPPKDLAPACLDFAPIVAPPDLAVSKNVTPRGIVDPGATLHYTIGVCNGASAGVANNVVVDDDVPLGTAYVPGSLIFDAAPMTDAADADAGTLTTPTHVRFTIPTLATGECKVAEFDVRVDAATTADVVNKAFVIADGFGPVNSNSVTTPINTGTVTPPDLSITKRSTIVGGGNAQVGSRITYSLRACNAAGAGDAANVVVTDPIPLDATTGCGAAYVADSITVNGASQTDANDGDSARFEALPAPGGIVVDVTSLPAGQCVDVTFDVTVAAGCDDREVVTNQATVAADSATTAQSNATSDTVTAVVPPEPFLMRKVGGPLANRCPSWRPPVQCGCEVGDRLDPLTDNCETAGTCTRTTATTWTVPGDVNVHVPLVFYEIDGAGCEASGDPTRMAVRKSGADIVISLVP